MRFRSSLATAIAAAMAAVVFTAASQPVEAAIFTWGPGGPNTGWASGGNWVGGSAPTAGNELLFGAPGVGTTRATANNIANGFIVNGIAFSGTTRYTLGNNASTIELRGDINDSSTGGLQTINLPINTNKGSAVNIVTSNTLAFGQGSINSPTDGVVFSGGGTVTFLNTVTGNVSTVAGTTLVAPADSNGIVGNVTLNGITQFPGNSSALPVTGDLAIGATGVFNTSVQNDLSYNVADISGAATYGGTFNLNLAGFDMDPSTLPNGTVFALFTSATSYAGNFSSVLASGTSATYPTQYGPVVGAWTLDGGNWKSPNIANGANPAQYFEFQPSTGNLVVVPEPTQMVFVAGVGAALGMWRLRKLRRNGRDSDATAC